MARAWETLDVHNGHIDWSFGRPTIVVYSAGGEGDGGGGGRWTGIVWFGNQIMTDYSQATDPDWPTNITGEYLAVDLRDGSSRFVSATMDDVDHANEQVFWVADYDEEYDTYRLNNHTQGDIHARIT